MKIMQDQWTRRTSRTSEIGLPNKFAKSFVPYPEMQHYDKYDTHEISIIVGPEEQVSERSCDECCTRIPMFLCYVRVAANYEVNFHRFRKVPHDR